MKRPWPALFLVGLAVRSDAFGGTKRSRTIARSWSGTDAPLKSAVFDRGWDENLERSSEVEVVDGCPLTADEEFIRLRNEIRNPTNSELNKKCVDTLAHADARIAHLCLYCDPTHSLWLFVCVPGAT